MTLELQSMRWLRWERRCPIVLSERSPREWPCGRPDVLGVSASRHLIEVEIKRSVTDFRADQQKPCRRARAGFKDKAPREFYYLVPVELVDKVRPLLPPWAGLLAGNGCIHQVFKSPTNHDATRLTVRECIRLVYLVSNEAISAWEACERTKQPLCQHTNDATTA